MKDEIIEEVWQIKEAIAKECDGNLDILVEKLRRQEKTSTSPVVDRSGLTQNKAQSG